MMHARYKWMGAALIALTALVPSEAHAGTTSPLSSLRSLPRPAPLELPAAPAAVPGLTVKSKDGHAQTRWLDLTASTGRGYCLASQDGGSRWMGAYGTSSRGSAEDLDLDRLVEKDGKVTLERTRVHFDPPSASVTAMGRSSVELQEVARTSAGIVVWAYREGKNVIVLARNVEGGTDSRRRDQDEPPPFLSVDGCPFAGARLDGRKPEAGSVAQLAGNLPAKGTGKEKVTPRFIIDASLSHVARDPEPVLAVRVRVRD
jgi:hypothetical protein